MTSNSLTKNWFRFLETKLTVILHWIVKNIWIISSHFQDDNYIARVTVWSSINSAEPHNNKQKNVFEFWWFWSSISSQFHFGQFFILGNKSLFFLVKEINMAAAHPPELKKFMDKKVLVKLPTGMTVEGVLRGFDPFMNMVLDESIGTNKAG